MPTRGKPSVAPDPSTMDAGRPTRAIGLPTAVTIIVGAMVGSGILLLPADMLALLPSQVWVLGIFGVAAVMTVLGALTVAELSGMYPKAGGQYVYLREAFGPFPAYLFGWANFWVIQTGTIAAVAAAFAKIYGKYFQDLPGDATPLRLGDTTLLTLPPYGEAFLAIGIILLLTAVNHFGVRFGGLVSNLSTAAKAAGLILVVLLVAFFYQGPSHALDVATPMHGDGSAFSGGELLAGFAGALLLILFAYDGWYMATYVAHEMRDPRRDGPRALTLAPLVTTVIYVAVALASLHAVSLVEALDVRATGDYLAGRAVMNAVGETGVVFVSIVALVSVFGTVNAYVLTAPRIAYAQAKDGLLMPAMARLHPKRATPAYGNLLCGIWASLLVMTGLYDQLVAAVVFAVFLFHVLTAWAWFRLRRIASGMDRPYRTPFGPVIPFLFLLTSASVVVATLVFPEYRNQALLGLGIIAAGVPFYFIQLRRYRPPETFTVEP